MWKKFLILDIILVIAAAVLAALWMFPVKTCGISSGFSTTDQLEDFLPDIPVYNVLSEGTSGYTDEEACERFLYQITDEGAWLHADHTLQIYIVEPAEMYIQVLDTYEQAVWVTETLQGDSQPGEQILIYGLGGIRALDEGAFFFGTYGKNFMMPGNQYLVFCEKTEYPSSELAEYRTIYTRLNVLNLSRDDEPFPEDFVPTGLWEQFRGRELLTYSNEDIVAFNELKQRVFEMYDIDLSCYRE